MTTTIADSFELSCAFLRRQRPAASMSIVVGRLHSKEMVFTAFTGSEIAPSVLECAKAIVSGHRPDITQFGFAENRDYLV